MDGVRCKVEPEISQIEEDVRIEVKGLQPGAQVNITMTSDDYYAINAPIKAARVGTVWQAAADYVADKTGTVKVAEQAPIAGCYATIDAMGLLTHMTPVKGCDAPLIQSVAELPEYRQVHFRLQVTNEEGVLCETSFIREFCDETVLSYDVQFTDMQARFFTTAEEKRHPAVIVLSGSDGRIEKAQAIAECLAMHGMAALAVGYFGMDGMSENLTHIPMDTIGDVVEWLKQNTMVDPNAICIYGRSKGGEMALLAASIFKDIHKVIAVMPSCFVHSGLTGNAPALHQSSWSYQGEEVPFLRFGLFPSLKMVWRMKHKDTFAMQKLYHETYVKNRNPKAVIPMEKIQGDILMITSKEDTVWPSKEYGDYVVKYLKAHNFPYMVEHKTYDGAGHMITLPNQSLRDLHKFGGGTKEKCIEATKEAWKEVVEFLPGK